MEKRSRQVDQASQSLNARLDAVTGEMNRTFAHALQQATQSLTGSIGTVREETRAAIQEKFVQVTDRLGDLKATNERIMEFSRSLDEFQRMLQSPKLRGDFGEFTLEQMLRDLLPVETLGMPGADWLLAGGCDHQNSMQGSCASTASFRSTISGARSTPRSRPRATAR